MTTLTPTLGLITYNETTDGSALFSTFRSDVAGTGTSNMKLIDDFATGISASVVALQANKVTIVVPATYSSPNLYISNGISQITSYVANTLICLSLDTTSSGAVTLNINGLGTRSLQKADVSGNLVNFEATELKKNHLYLFKYNGSVWVWEAGTSIDQISTIGTTNNLLMIGPCAVVIDSTISTTGSRISGSYIVLTTTGVSSGSYNALEVDVYGRVISGSNIAAAAANLSLSNITSASVPVDLNPSIAGSKNLGSSILSWFTGFFNKVNFISGSVSTPSASQVSLYNNNKLLYSKDEDGTEYFVSQKKKGNFFIVYPNPTTTNGATAAVQIELTGSNYTDFNNVEFGYSGSPTGTIDFGLPWDYDGGSFTANFHFYTSASVSSSAVDVKMGIAGRAYASGDMLDQAPSSFTYATTTSGSSANRFFISPTSGSFAVSGSPAPYNGIHYVFQRDNGVVNNLQSAIKLYGVNINYTRAQN